MRKTVLIVLMVLVGCANNDGNTEAVSDRSAETLAPSISAMPTETKPPKLPLQEARLTGAYDVKLFEANSNYGSRPDNRQVFRFKPKCKTGACDVTITGNMQFVAQGATARRQGGAVGRFSARLPLLGKRYEGQDTGYYAECDGAPNKDTWTFDIQADDATYVDEDWTVTKWSGTWTRSSPANGVCSSSHLRAVIRGTLTE